VHQEERTSLSLLNKKHKIGMFLIGPHVRDQQKRVEEVWFGSITWVYPSLVLYKKWIKIPYSPAPFFLKTT